MTKSLKTLLAQIVNSIKTISTNLTSEIVVNGQFYTSSTSWQKVATFTASKSGIYRIRTSYANSSVLGMAIGASSATSIIQTYIMAENTTGASIDMVKYIEAGSYSIWTKCGSNGATNGVQVWRIMTV